MIVRSHLAYLKEWINDRLADITSGKTPNPEKTFAHYWIKNAGDGANFAHQDVVFEVFHNSWRSASGATRCTTSC
jgi:hypothetical protein